MKSLYNIIYQNCRIVKESNIMCKGRGKHAFEYFARPKISYEWRNGKLCEIRKIIWEKVFTHFNGCFPRCFVYASIIRSIFPGKKKKINVFNLKLTQRFTLLIFYFHATELLFSISSVPGIHVFLVRNAGTKGAISWPRGSSGWEVVVSFRDLGYNRKRGGLYLWVRPCFALHTYYIFYFACDSMYTMEIPFNDI